jgi:geranylgeranylglycerol-phosphate geranylgeranyltransferase
MTHPRLTKVVAFFTVIRVVNSCAVFAATFVGGLLSMRGRVALGTAQILSDNGQSLPGRGALPSGSGGFLSGRGGLPSASGEFSTIALAAASMFFLAAFGYALNDYYDVRADEKNRPSRPIPSGTLSRRYVLRVAIFCVIIAALFALRLRSLALIILAAMCVLVWLYSARIKRSGLGGNVLVSLLAGSTLLFGGLSAGDVRPTLFPALLAFLVNLPREILKDVQDLKGDSVAGSRSVASTRGEGFALRLASVFLCFLVVVSFLPYVAGLYHRYYFAIVLLLDALLVWVAVSMWTFGSRSWLASERKLAAESRLVSEAGLVSERRPKAESGQEFERRLGVEGTPESEHRLELDRRSEIERRTETAIRILKFAMLAGLLAIGLGGL